MRVAEQRIFAKAKLARPLAWDELGRRRQKGSFKLGLLPELLEKGRAARGSSSVGFGKIRQVDDTPTRRDLQAAGSTDDQITLYARGAYRLDQGVRLGQGEVDRADHGIVTAQRRRQALQVLGVALDGDDAGQLGDSLRMASNCSYAMPTVSELSENARAGEPEAPINALWDMTQSFV